MSWECVIFGAAMAVLAGSGAVRACEGNDFGPGCAGWVDPTPPPVVVADDDRDPSQITPPHRAWSKCCIDPANPLQRVAKTDLGDAFPRWQARAHAQCQAIPLAEMAVCPEGLAPEVGG